MLVVWCALDSGCGDGGLWFVWDCCFSAVWFVLRLVVGDGFCSVPALVFFVGVGAIDFLCWVLGFGV